MKATITLIAFIVVSAMNLFGQTTVSTLVDDAATPFTDDIIQDASGNLYCADYSGDAVFKRTPAGTVSTFASGLNTPNGLAFNQAGELYVCDNIGNRIYKFDATGTPLDTIDVVYPSGIIKDVASDTMIFTNYGSVNAIKKLAPDGNVSDFHVGGELDGPVGLEYCQGELYVANFNDRKIFRVEQDTLVYITQLPGSGYLGFLANAGDHLLATSFNGQKIYRIDPIVAEVNLYAGSITGSTDGALDSAKFSRPNGIYVNPAMDSIYISEYNTGKLRLISGFTLGVPEMTVATAFKAYPNPFQNELSINYSSEQPFTLTMLTLDGKTVHQIRDLNTDEVHVPLNNIESGSYLIQIEIDGSIVAQQRVVRY